MFNEFYTSRILLRAKSCKYSSTIKFQTKKKKKRLTSMQLLVMTKQEHIDLRSLLRLQKPVVENRRENYMTYLFSWSEARRPRQCVWISNDGSYCSLSWSLRLRLFLAISQFLAAAAALERMQGNGVLTIGRLCYMGLMAHSYWKPRERDWIFSPIIQSPRWLWLTSNLTIYVIVHERISKISSINSVFFLAPD